MMSIPLEDYSLALALEDIVPVVLSAIALLAIARLVRLREPSLGALALDGALLVVLGGASKAIWKLLVTAAGIEVAVLERALFGLMAPGFVIVAITFSAAASSQWARGPARALRARAAAPAFVVTCFALAMTGIRALELILLALTVVGSTVLLVRAIGLARTLGRPGVGALLGFTLSASFALGFIGSLEQTIALQWTEQLTNTAAQAAFAVAAVALLRSHERVEVRI